MKPGHKWSSFQFTSPDNGILLCQIFTAEFVGHQKQHNNQNNPSLNEFLILILQNLFCWNIYNTVGSQTFSATVPFFPRLHPYSLSTHSSFGSDAFACPLFPHYPPGFSHKMALPTFGTTDIKKYNINSSTMGTTDTKQCNITVWLWEPLLQSNIISQFHFGNHWYK